MLTDGCRTFDQTSKVRELLQTNMFSVDVERYICTTWSRDCLLVFVNCRKVDRMFVITVIMNTTVRFLPLYVVRVFGVVIL